MPYTTIGAGNVNYGLAWHYSHFLYVSFVSVSNRAAFGS